MISTKCETDDIFSVHRIPIVQCHLSIELVKLTAKNSNLIVTAKVYLTLGSYAIVVMVMVILNWVIYGKSVR